MVRDPSLHQLCALASIAIVFMMSGLAGCGEKQIPPSPAASSFDLAAISKLTADYIAYGVAEFSEETTDLYGNEELLIDQGNYVMVYGKDKTTERGKYDLHAQPPRLSRQPCPAVRLSNAPSSSTSPSSSMG